MTLGNIKRIAGQDPNNTTMRTLSTMSEIFTDPAVIVELQEKYKDYFPSDITLDHNSLPDPIWTSTIAKACALIHTNGNKRAAGQVTRKIDEGILRLAYDYLFPRYYKAPFNFTHKNALTIEQKKERWNLVLRALEAPNELWPAWVIPSMIGEELVKIIDAYENP